MQEEQQPHDDYVSQETKLLVAAVRRVANSINFELGIPMKNPNNGDAMWFVLTDDESNIYIIIITPYVIMLEIVQGDEEELTFLYSLVDSISIYLEHLQNVGGRKLSDSELRYFLGLEPPDDAVR